MGVLFSLGFLLFIALLISSFFGFIAMYLDADPEKYNRESGVGVVNGMYRSKVDGKIYPDKKNAIY